MQGLFNQIRRPQRFREGQSGGHHPCSLSYPYYGKIATHYVQVSDFISQHGNGRA